MDVSIVLASSYFHLSQTQTWVRNRLEDGDIRYSTSVALSPWDFFVVLRHDPLLGAELEAQCALLAFIQAGERSSDLDELARVLGNDALVKYLYDDDKLAAVNDVPADSAVRAFICLAKLKMCRIQQVCFLFRQEVC